MNVKEIIKQKLIKALESLELPTDHVQVSTAADATHGDYASNVAMIVVKKAGRAPLEVAQEIVSKLEEKSDEMFAKITVAKPGFINFLLADKYLVEKVEVDFEASSSFKNKNIVVEYTDPNPFKELHIGHLYSNIIGESLCRIFETSGATVRRVDYYGDVGMHVARSIWGIMQLMQKQEISLADLEKKPLSERVAFLGEGYALGSNAFAADEAIAAEIKDINYLVYMSGQEYLEKKYDWKAQIDYKKYLRPENEALYAKVKEIYEKGKDWSLENFEVLYKRLGTKFDGYYPESIAGERGYKIVKDNITSGIFVESEGAIIFPGEKMGLHNRVFINKLGLPTYEAKELGLAPWKYEEFAYDLSFIVTATEIAGYFGVLVEALKKVNPDLGAKTKPILHGMVKLPEGKMSSRSGNVITVTWLFDEAKAKVLPLVSDAAKDKEAVAEMVGVAAVKYAFLRSSIGKDIVFNLDESVSFDGNSGPYLQYTYARTTSVLRKSEMENGEWQMANTSADLQPEERNLLRLLVRYPDIVEEAASKYAPNILCTYLFELAQAFNLFYQTCPILKAEDSVKAFRLALTDKTGETIKHGLNLLGIQAPEQM